MMYTNASVEITMEEKHNDLTEMQEFHGPNYEELKNLALLTFHMHSPAVKPNILFSLYCTLTHPKLLRCLADRCLLLDNISSNLDCTFFDVIFHKKSLHKLFLQSMQGTLGNMIL